MNKIRPKNLSRRNFISMTSLAMAASPLLSSCSILPETRVAKKGANVEWRNKQAGMAYRKLGDTGLMISEVVNGGDPVRLDNYRMVNVALERGVNYLDMAPAYGNGDCERAYSKIIDSSAKREKVFMTTKLSSFNGVRNGMYKELFDGLPSGKQEAILKKANALREKRGVDKPGYYLTYWPAMTSPWIHRTSPTP